MEVYRVFLHTDLLDAVPPRGSRRLEILRFIRSLGDAPDTPGDYTEEDPSLRICQVKIVGGVALTYWIDDPAKAVMVVAARPADL
jgi:hypothetical protein